MEKRKVHFKISKLDKQPKEGCELKEGFIYQGEMNGDDIQVFYKDNVGENWIFQAGSSCIVILEEITIVDPQDGRTVPVMNFHSALVQAQEFMNYRKPGIDAVPDNSIYWGKVYQTLLEKQLSYPV